MTLYRTFHTLRGPMDSALHRTFDLLDLKRFPSKTFSSYQELFGVTSRMIAERMAHRLIKEMLRALAHDMADRAVWFVLPRRGTGYIYVQNAGHPQSAMAGNYRRHLEPQPEQHRIEVRLDKKFRQKLKHRLGMSRYYMKPSIAMKMRIHQRVLQGDRFNS
jgi:hypothetical protein